MSLNNELHKVSTWLDANKLSINTKKTHVMVFHRSRIKTNDVNVVNVIQQNTIDCVNSTNFLGLIIDDKLKWHEHIQHFKHKIVRSVGIIYKIRHYHNKQTILNMYYTFVFPYLIYGDIRGKCPIESHNIFLKKFFFNVYEQLLFQSI